jgi:hypothetical protein
MADFITASICLDKIPKDAGYIKIGKDGKKYISIVIAEGKEPDAYENTHYIYLSQTKEQREAKEKKIYLGNGKAYQPKTTPVSVEDVAEMPVATAADVDDLPF